MLHSSAPALILELTVLKDGRPMGIFSIREGQKPTFVARRPLDETDLRLALFLFESVGTLNRLDQETVFATLNAQELVYDAYYYDVRLRNERVTQLYPRYFREAA